MVNYDYDQALEILKANNKITVKAINMDMVHVFHSWDLDPHQDGLQIMTKLINLYNPVGKYYNLYRDN